MKKIVIPLIVSVALVALGQSTIKISQLPQAITISGTESIPLVQGGVTKQAFVSQLAPGVAYTGLSGTPTQLQLTNSAQVQFVFVSTNTINGQTIILVQPVTVGITTNITISAHVLSFTNGILQNYQ